MEPSREEILAVYEQGPEAVIALVQNLVAAFTARIQVLEDRVHTLEARLRQDSHNSSKPPSSDPGHRRTDRRRRTRSLRPRS